MQRQQQQQHQHQWGASLNRRSLLGAVINTVLTSQTMSIEHSTDNIQARDVITPGGAAL